MSPRRTAPARSRSRLWALVGLVPMALAMGVPFTASAGAAPAGATPADGACGAVKHNLVTNCGFEQGLSGWSVTSGLASVVGIDPHSGAYNYVASGDDAPVDLTQTLVGLRPGATYRLEFYARNSVPGQATESFTVTVSDVRTGHGIGTKTLYSDSTAVTPLGGDYGSKITAWFRVPRGSAGGSHVLDFSARNDTGGYFVDDVAVTRTGC